MGGDTDGGVEFDVSFIYKREIVD